MYAVNLADWTAYKDDFELRWLLEPVVEQRFLYCERERLDGMALPITCDETRANAIMTIIRRKFHRNQSHKEGREYFGTPSIPVRYNY